ncbi:GNAT family N-acetyltransferase [Lentibacillus halophilus]|uniref:GNAT family N-acetyltransferase n=1 Tax=Lentibacillus halophilus TaxID=295065 RepID=A0ABN0Z5U9_9BACI
MLKQLDAEADAKAIFSLSQFAFQYTLSEEVLQFELQKARDHMIWGWMTGDELAAKLHLIPLTCYINGQPFAMGGVSAVATWPEYRRQGMVKQLLEHALHYMHRHGWTVSFLHPFSFAFYRKYGWEHVFSEKKYHIRITTLQRPRNIHGYVRRIGDELDVLQAIYTKYAKGFNGTLDRDTKWWQQRVLADHLHKAVAYYPDGTADGYMLYYVKNNIMYVHEIVCQSIHAQQLMLQFIADHDSMADTVEMTVPEYDHLPLLLDEPRIEQTIHPYFMARIVDVPSFLKHYPFRDAGQIHFLLHIDDAFLPVNNGTYHVLQMGSETTVTCLPDSGQNQPAIHCRVGYLASMLFGYKRPGELYRADLVQGEKEAIDQLESIIPDREPYFPDFF